MAQVAAAVLAGDFDAGPIGVGFSMDRAFDFIVESWPAAPAVELVVGFVKRSVATLAKVGSFDEMVGVLSGKGVFGPFVEQHPAFFRGQFVVFRFFHLLTFGVSVQPGVGDPATTNRDFRRLFAFFLLSRTFGVFGGLGQYVPSGPKQQSTEDRKQNQREEPGKFCPGATRSLGLHEDLG